VNSNSPRGALEATTPPDASVTRTGTGNNRTDLFFRGSLTLGALVIDGLAIAFTHFGISGVPRLWLGLAFVFFVPGWAIVGLLTLRWPAGELSLTLALGLAIALLVAQVLLWAHAWQPANEQLGLGAGSGVLFVAQLWRSSTMLRSQQ
jgi:hypothetical protein